VFLREVQSLLAQPASGRGFLDRPAIPVNETLAIA
jgi:hypothetical protein